MESKRGWNLSQFPLDVAGGTSQGLAINVKQANSHSYLRATEPIPVGGSDHCTRVLPCTLMNTLLLSFRNF